VKTGDLVRIENSDILGLILSPPKKRYMIGQAALVFWNGETKYVLESKLTLVEKEND
tara:strand:- start:305 stop:475 length:171 start_codon:yes stop_codon:yes gene_type:complete